MTAVLRITMLATASALLLAACETPPSGGGGGGTNWSFGPGYVDIGGNKRFGVSYLPDMQAAMLTFTLVDSFRAGEEPPEPPVPEEWRAAAEQAAPEGCTVDRLEQVSEEQWRAYYDCGDAA
jgi:hypothetical protein